MSVVDRVISRMGQVVSANGTAIPHPGRIRMDGKRFTRDGQRLHVRGVTYGPFAPSADNGAFPARARVADDFARMRSAGITSLRTYSPPPDWLLDLADEQDLAILMDVPWPKHLCFLDSRSARQEARQLTREVACRGGRHRCVLGYSIGNEIPANIVRWHGTRPVQRFLQELMDVVKQADPDGLCTYANYPSTEYLDLSFLDFATFNVYLHDLETFRRYLFRLQNLVGDRPLVLGELGMDTFRHGCLQQADFLAGHVREALLMGLAGVFVFSWTDDWHTGGHAIADWAFGITEADRTPKPAYHALREVFECPPAAMLPTAPRVSVVVCTYNGGRTLEQCLRSLLALDYPDYEVLVIDDGSTDDTSAILARISGVRVLRQPNQGLSSARNAGLWAATGDIVAYTDSDCFADPDWLTHLVYQLQRSDAAAVGGPNLTPDDGRLAACVAACAGQPTHVLESDQVAEHIPGCNMAFRRTALLAINGFDPVYHTAGDDVDVCWRLQQAGQWITFAPGAFVWHHRRHTPRAYLRQQAGYGQAEALLQLKHPDKFNGYGQGKWRGVLYGSSLQGLRIAPDVIYRGVFGAGLFQCLYHPGPAHWATLPSTFEWYLAASLVALVGFLSPVAWGIAAVMLGLSLAVAALQAAQARLALEHNGLSSRLLIAGLSLAQPLVRSGARYRTRLFSTRAPIPPPPLPARRRIRVPVSGHWTVAYWSEVGRERTELLEHFLAHLTERRWGKTIDPGWSSWDVEIHCHPWTIVRVCTAEEDHGGGRRLLRVRYRVSLTGLTRVVGGVAAAAASTAALHQSWPVAVGAATALVFCLVVWRRGVLWASDVAETLEASVQSMDLIRCPP